MEWKTYVKEQTHPVKADLRLFPGIRQRPLDTESMLVNRFRWLARVQPESHERVFQTWGNPEDAFLEERLADMNRPLQVFHQLSKTFPALLAKTEVDRLNYYSELYEFCRIMPVREAVPVVVVGPTFGGEIEAIDEAGGIGCLCGRWNRWLSIAEERLLHDRVGFESLKGEFSAKTYTNHFIVVSSWVPDPVNTMRLVYDSLGDFGFVLFPRRTISLSAEASRLGLMRKFDGFSDLDVFYKDAGMPSTSGG